jgi:CCR4-NOT transcription complex subunit 3
MEKFKAVEKEMKTKAYSKEGLSAASKLDPKEKEKIEAIDFLQDMVESLSQQIEASEAETENLQASMKKGKKDTSKADRIAEIEKTLERHKWHNQKLELVLRALQNGNVDAEQVKDLEDSIRYYVENNQEVDFMEDDSIYDELNLQEEEDLYGMNNELDRVSSQDAQSVQEDQADAELRSAIIGPSKAKGASDSAGTQRRPSQQMKSPLPTLATLHAPSLPSGTNGTVNTNAKSSQATAPPPKVPEGGLKYASAAAAAAASDKNGVGIAPLPPPPSASAASHPASGLVPLPAAPARRPSIATSPLSTTSQPVLSKSGSESVHGAQSISKSPALSHSSAAAPGPDPGSIPPTPALEKAAKVTAADDSSKALSRGGDSVQRIPEQEDAQNASKTLTNGDSHKEEERERSIYHLPSSLQDLLDSFEATKADSSLNAKQIDERLLVASHTTFPESVDAERPRHYRPQNPYPYTPDHYPQEPLAIFDDPRLYTRIETDALFYAFYYRQGTYQQFLAAKALKSQSWRFHKQYQTWFQRHEEPKSITEDYEQGTYRFFDYESTW